MEQPQGKEVSRKKPYIAPKVMKVDLAAEEVALGNCKASSGTSGSKSPGYPCLACGVSIGS